MRKITALALAGAAFTTSSLVQGEPSLSATPYRPTLSNPAVLSTPGWIEIEAGLQRSHSSGDRYKYLPYTIKLALDEDWGILLGGNAYLQQTIQGERQSGQGDTSFTLKRRFAMPANPELGFGMELGVKSPTAKKPLGSGKADWMANGILSLDLTDTWHLDTNFGMTLLGRHSSDEGPVASVVSAALSKNLGDWTLAVEWAGTRQRGTNHEHSSLVAASYTLTPRWVVDMGAARTRQGQTTEHTVFIGFTWLAAKVF